MKSRVSLLAALLTGALPFATLATHAGEIRRSASVFEEADEGSKQVLTLKKGGTAQVTGPVVLHESQAWLPVTVEDRSGWIESNAIKLTDGDVGFAASSETQSDRPRLPRVRVWGGIGPALVVTSAVTDTPTTFPGNSYAGATFAVGAEALLGKTRLFSLGGELLLPWVAEQTSGFGGGRLRRIAGMATFGYSVLPQKLSILAHLGLTVISGESTNFIGKVSITPGLSVEYQFSPFERGTVYQSIELGVYRMSEASGYGGDVTGITSGLCSGINGVFGGSSSDPTCTPGVAPTAYAFAALYKIGWLH